jgi:hypothetical protein
LSALPPLPESALSALQSAWESDTESRLVTSGKSPGLFTGKGKAVQDSIDVCTNADSPLLETTRTETKGKAVTKFVRITPAGVRRLCDELPPERLAAIPPRRFTALPPDDAVDVIRRCAERLSPGAALELLRAAATDLPDRAGELLTAAVEQAETRYRAERAAQQQRAELARQADARLDELLERIAAHKLELAARLEDESRAARASAAKLRGGRTPTAEVGATRTDPPRPKTEADADFQYRLAQEIVFTWEDAARKGLRDAQEYLEVALSNVSGLEPVGETDESVAFDGAYHQCDRPVSDGALVRVVRPGWLLRNNGKEFLLSKALVE